MFALFLGGAFGIITVGGILIVRCNVRLYHFGGVLVKGSLDLLIGNTLNFFSILGIIVSRSREGSDPALITKAHYTDAGRRPAHDPHVVSAEADYYAVRADKDNIVVRTQRADSANISLLVADLVVLESHSAAAL